MKSKFCGIPVESKVFLSPMVGFTSRASRIQCKQYGAGFTYIPMEHSEAVNFNEEILKKLKPVKEELPCGIQLTGADEKSLIKAVEKVEKLVPLIDLNFGCPSKKILSSKCGAWHLKDLKKMKELISAVASVSNKPVTVKTRIGFDAPQTEKIMKAIDTGAASAITLHGRTVKQGYSGKADWNEIKKAKKLSCVPLIGNGDIENAEQGNKLIEQKYCDYVMIGRGALGNPICFSEIPMNKSKSELIKEFIKLNEIHGFDESELKTQLIQFIKGIRGASIIRKQLSEAKTIIEINNALKELKE
ncbi:MAG: tRNA-dihydrouridine synthase family protein [Candidatus Diapherotrites archaeon]|nr:tRNA-dihydrouridine synthase family protein [Candidatus Diapherotrites archaeon]